MVRSASPPGRRGARARPAGEARRLLGFLYVLGRGSGCSRAPGRGGGSRSVAAGISGPAAGDLLRSAAFRGAPASRRKNPSQAADALSGERGGLAHGALTAAAELVAAALRDAVSDNRHTRGAFLARCGAAALGGSRRWGRTTAGLAAAACGQHDVDERILELSSSPAAARGLAVPRRERWSGTCRSRGNLRVDEVQPVCSGSWRRGPVSPLGRGRRGHGRCGSLAGWRYPAAPRRAG